MSEPDTNPNANTSANATATGGAARQLASMGAAIAWINELQAQVKQLQEMVNTLAVRVTAQSEMLGCNAERRGETTDRIAELEKALGPFAAVLESGWDRGELPATALYPVRMGDLRRAARVLAETQRAGQ